VLRIRPATHVEPVKARRKAAANEGALPKLESSRVRAGTFWWVETRHAGISGDGWRLDFQEASFRSRERCGKESGPIWSTGVPSGLMGARSATTGASGESSSWPIRRSANATSEVCPLVRLEGSRAGRQSCCAVSVDGATCRRAQRIGRPVRALERVVTRCARVQLSCGRLTRGV